jgi:ubiquinone/menaquinone biosynthesis C-methylase UbiE
MRIDFNTYADAYQRNRAVQPKVLLALIEGGDLARSDAVLEIGCGTANYLAAIVAETGARGTGVDPAERMLAEARLDPEKDDLELLLGSAEELPVADSAARFAYSVDVIHHVGDRARAAREAFRVLAPGGRLCIATDSAQDIANRVPLASHFPETVAHELRRYPAIGTIITELADAGFAELKTTHVCHEYALTDVVPYRERAFSSLRLITDDELAAGLTRMERDLADGPIAARSVYTLVWATRP